MAEYLIETGGTLEPWIGREWLLTNGLGASASGTVVGCNTRRYHSLLCAALLPPGGRQVMLSRVGEVVNLDGAASSYELSVNQFEHHLHPRGYQHLVEFALGLTARWVYRVEDVLIRKELLLCWQRNICGIRYQIEPSGREVRLEMLPFVAMRDFHSLRHGTDAAFETQSWGNHVTLMHQKQFLHLAADQAAWEDRPYWWYGHEYRIERERGLDYQEELWNPGCFVLSGREKMEVTVWASCEHVDMPVWEKQLELRRQARASAMVHLPQQASEGVQKLWRAADDFVVTKKLPQGRVGKTILAGYPWFMDWGRDTMISLPGLLLVTQRYEQALAVLESFAEHVSEGMVPNRFDDWTGEPHYNTVDASLWFVHAVYEYLAATRDQEHAGALIDACRKVVEGYRRGTRFNIHMDEADGLITQGDAQTQLTWMDAKHGQVAFTPRQGKPVEINALWYHALVLLEEKELAARVKKSFVEAYWISPWRGLADVVDGGRQDGSIRPNQIFAVSLPNSPLSADQQRAVVEVVRRELLTPYGLRTLSPGNERYRGRFEGQMADRDAAYHNGTVWPWLMGPFIEAYLKTRGYTDKAKAQARQWLSPLVTHLDDQCLGQIAEVFDGDEPQRPGGCCAQAWSVAEVLRAAVLAGL